MMNNFRNTRTTTINLPGRLIQNLTLGVALLIPLEQAPKGYRSTRGADLQTGLCPECWPCWPSLLQARTGLLIFQHAGHNPLRYLVALLRLMENDASTLINDGLKPRWQPKRHTPRANGNPIQADSSDHASAAGNRGAGTRANSSTWKYSLACQYWRAALGAVET